MPVKDDTWSERQSAIREILGNDVIRSQAQLLERLEERGYLVTQSSISRDLQELHVAKLDGRYVPAENLVAAPAPTDELALAAAAVQRVREAGANLVVVATPPGRAQVVAVALDHAGWPEILGTVAGDDTLFIAVAGRREQLRVKQRLSRLRLENRHV